MCYPVKCEKCGKTTWAGSGKHKDMVMAKVPENERCTCKREGQAEAVPDKPNTSSGNHGKVSDIESEDQFNELLSKEKLVVADFFATWCGPCKAMAPIVRNIYIIFQFAKVSEELTDVKFVKINGDENDELMEKYEIAGFPTFAVFKNGKLVDSKSGRLSLEELKEFIESKK